MTPTQRRGATTSSDIFRDVLCGIDGTRTSYEAVRQAASLVSPGARLTLLAVCATGTGKHPVAVLAPERARRVLDHGRRLAKEAGASAEIELEPGGPVVDVVLSRAREHALLALGAPSMSRLAHLVVGGITTKAAHVLPSALLVARRRAVGARPGERILVASDALDRSDQLVEFAIDLALARRASLVLIHAARTESGARPTRISAQIKRVSQDLGELSIVRVEPGRAHAAILKTAAQEGASLVVLSSHRKRGLRALGSVSERVVHDAPCSVLVVRPDDLRG